MKYLSLIIFLCLATNSYGQDQKQPTNTRIKNYELSLNNKQDECYLSYKGSKEGTLKLDIPFPCHFNSYQNGEVQKFDYSDIGDTSVIVVVGKNIDQSCIIQGILIREDEIEKSERFNNDHSTYCGPFDEKVFWLLAH